MCTIIFYGGTRTTGRRSSREDPPRAAAVAAPAAVAAVAAAVASTTPWSSSNTVLPCGSGVDGTDGDGDAARPFYYCDPGFGTQPEAGSQPQLAVKLILSHVPH
ncbi:hypothetical protein HZH66_013261 [Vespula vulgaris]|uniref:Uncharacterized protein n=1 Tax=Vespula vulgaris TaxID=7454 RepID=A0A834J9F3_VESVU|nr:hypothetical protein HZH66_013261 [Vespula vulgaris]